MKPNAVALLLSVYLSALPGYHYQFPADHFNHPQFQTEWWYYTGNLHDASDHRYGFELTFFRQALQLPQSPIDSVWRPDQIYLAHLALTDIDGHTFYHMERLNRAGPGIAGVDLNARKIWNGNWQVYWKDVDNGEQQLQAICERFGLRLDLSPLKPPVIHGKDGVSQKGLNEASHYISFTRLRAEGNLNGQTVSGVAWMDHEFFTQPQNPTVAGWDWFAIELENNEELMLYRLRDRAGEISQHSSGTYVDAKGGAHHLTADQVIFTPGRVWHKYPMEWKIDIPSLGLQLLEKSTLDDQELVSGGDPSPSYWEGAVTYEGTIRGKPTRGLGYLEMTGYGQAIRLGH